VSFSIKFDALTKPASVVGSVDSETSGLGEGLCCVVVELRSAGANFPVLFERAKNKPTPKTAIDAKIKE
jgi:hypothetical protein